MTARQLANQLWAAYADAEEAPVGTAATQLREMRDAEAAKLTTKHERISARRAAAERTEDELEAELMADLATGLGVEQPGPNGETLSLSGASIIAVAERLGSTVLTGDPHWAR